MFCDFNPIFVNKCINIYIYFRYNKITVKFVFTVFAFVGLELLPVISRKITNTSVRPPFFFQSIFFMLFDVVSLHVLW